MTDKQNELSTTDEPLTKRSSSLLLREQPEPSEHSKKRGFNNLELLNEFQAFSRQPFIEILSELIQGIPTPGAIKAFAEAHPDKWASTIKTIANLAGYHDKLEIEGNLTLDVNKMGDAQLIAKLDELGAKIDSMGIRTGITEAVYEEVDVEEAKKEASLEKPTSDS